LGQGEAARVTAAPYPVDTRAKGWRFELDHERIRQSDTWALAAPECRPWLLMLWMVAWEQTPCGSLPNDDNLIAARIGMTPKTFAKAKPSLMRRWWLADDGRLYHDVIVSRVLQMAEKRAKEAARKAGNRHGSPTPVPRDNTGTDDTRTGITGTEKNYSEAIASAAAAAQVDRVEAVFTLGIPLLTAAGVPEKNARSFLGRLRRFNGDGVIVQAIDRCAKANAVQPVEFLQGCLKTSAVHHNRQEAIEESNRAVGDAWVKKMEALDAH
jgi:hypothetical protein